MPNEKQIESERKRLSNELVEKCALIAERWVSHQYALLHAGEMTAQELRSIRAVATEIAGQIRGLKEWLR